MGLAALAGGVIALSGVTSAFGAYSEGKSRQQVAEYNSALALQEGVIARQEAAASIARQKRFARSFTARQEAAYAKAGVTLSGSVLQVTTEDASALIYDQMLTNYTGLLKASKAQSQADADVFTGKLYANEGLFKAGSTLLSTSGSLLSLGALSSGGGNKSLPGGEGLPRIRGGEDIRG